MRMPLQWYAFHGDIPQNGLKLIVKKWQVCPGMGGRFIPESVAGCDRCAQLERLNYKSPTEVKKEYKILSLKNAC
jgi:hypothetical protein